jgi:hypothetical protein
LKLSRLCQHQPDIAEWWVRIKARPSYAAAITNWLRPEDKLALRASRDPWIEVSENFAAEQGKNTECSQG